MRKLLALLILLAGPAWATNYYVDCNAANDSDTGLIGHPWKTINKVNISSFNPGDSILFKKTCTWREQLEPPSSGSSGSPITFGDYGSGALPIITGADLVAGPWTQATATPLVSDTLESGTPSAWWTASAGSLDANSLITGVNSWRVDADNEMLHKSELAYAFLNVQFNLRIDSGSAPSSGHKTRWEVVKAHPNYVCMWLSWNGTNYYIGANTSTTTAAANFILSTNTNYAIEIQWRASDGAYYLKVGGSTKSSGTQTSIVTVAEVRVGHDGWNSSSFICYLDDVKVYNSDPTVQPDRWSAAVTTQPRVVIVSRALGSLKASAADVVSAGQWYWAANVLHVGFVGNPGATAVEAGVRNNPLVSNTKDYIKLQNLQVEGSNTSTVGSGAILVLNGSDGWQIDGVVAQFNAQSGIFFDSAGGLVSNVLACYNGSIGVDFDSADGMTGTDIVAHHNGLVGVYLGAIIPPAVGNTFKRITAYSNTNHGFCLDHADGTILEDGVFYSNGYNGIWVGAYANNDVDGATIRRNRVYSNGDAGIRVEGSTTVNLAVYHNLIYGNTNEGIYLKSAAPSNLVYNNVVKGNGKGIRIDDAGTMATIKNNASYDNTIEVYVDADVNQALVFDYNDWYHSAGGTFLYWKGTTYNFADWKTASGQDAHSLNSDPLFTNAGTGDFTLQAGSPCIEKGVSLGAAYIYMLSPTSTWPSGVLLMDWHATGGAPDIGAYDYRKWIW